MPENQLQILCEIPLKIKISDRDFEVRPLTFKKIAELQPFVEKIVGKLDDFRIVDFMAGNWITPMLKNVTDVMEDLLDALEIVLIGDYDKEFLRENLDTITLGKILGFLVKTTNIEETVKNVVVLRGMAK